LTPPDIDIEKYTRGEIPTTDGDLHGQGFGMPKILTLLYTGGDADDKDITNTQLGKAFLVDPNNLDDGNDDSVYIIGSKRANGGNARDQFFAGTVLEDTSFDLSIENPGGATKFGAQTYVLIYSEDPDAGGTLLQTVSFHTSWSKPLALGDEFAAVTLIGMVDTDGAEAVLTDLDPFSPENLGENADLPTGPEINVGEKAIWHYVVTNPGEVDLDTIVVRDDDETPADLSDDFFPEPVLTEAGFNVGDTDMDGVLDTGDPNDPTDGEQWLFMDMDYVTEEGQHTNKGFVTGESVITGQEVMDMDPSNHFGVMESFELCAEHGRPQVLAMTYTGDGNDATSHSQDPSKVNVTGDPMDEATVRIISAERADGSGKIYFDGVVNLGESFGIDSTNAGDNSLRANTYVLIYDLDGNLLQTINFHTSCSQDLFLGDQFGGIKLVGFVGESGGQSGMDPDVTGVNPPPIADNGSVSASNLQIAGKTLSIDLTNNSGGDITIDSFLFDWASSNKKLRKIRLGGAVIYDSPDIPDSGAAALINSFIGSTTIDDGATLTLTFEFERNVDSDLSLYDLTIAFASIADLDVL
jgi:hypothetical protein